MKGDVNCLFSAIAYAVTDCQSKYTTIRHFIVSWMGNNNAKIETFFGSNYINESSMSSDGVWAIYTAHQKSCHDKYIYLDNSSGNRHFDYVTMV